MTNDHETEHLLKKFVEVLITEKNKIKGNFLTKKSFFWKIDIKENDTKLFLIVNET